MNILAIDPGTRDSAFVGFDTETERVLEHGFVENSSLLAGILTSTHGSLVIESIQGFGMTAGQELFDTCFWSGRFCQAFNGEFIRIGRRDIKLHLCGVVSAKDKDVREALVYRFGNPGTKKNPGKLYGISGHCWSALAVAVYQSDKKGKV